MFDTLIKTIQEAVTPRAIEVNGRSFVSRPVHLPPAEPLASAIQIHSLSGIVDYVNETKDAQDMVVVIESATEVGVYRWLDEYRNRENLLNATAIATEFKFNIFYGLEPFLISLQSQFVPSSDLDAALSILGNLADETSVKYEDDGVTQKVTAKTGIARVGEVSLPRILNLYPYRTFADIPQPAGKFLLRIKKGDQGPGAGLFEADGRLWEVEAIASIKAYLGKGISRESVKIMG